MNGELRKSGGRSRGSQIRLLTSAATWRKGSPQRAQRIEHGSSSSPSVSSVVRSGSASLRRQLQFGPAGRDARHHHGLRLPACLAGPKRFASAVSNEPPPDDPVRIPITGELDLHTFQAREVGGLLGDYLGECRIRGIHTVRVVHGKGTGALRDRVHAWLRRSPLVASFALCDETAGGWGATRVVLREGGVQPEFRSRVLQKATKGAKEE
jgi:hypothetical protein